MNIGIIGLGLIGGTMARSLKENTAHVLWGRDRNPTVEAAALRDGVIDRVLTSEDLPGMDFLLIALYPAAAIDALTSAAPRLQNQAIVVDLTGIKRDICRVGRELSARYGFTFIGGHPMAGVAASGYEHAAARIFRGASMILTPEADVNLWQIERARALFLSAGFGRITIVTPENHDRIIAYTSQLAHVLSSAYIKSPTALDHRGLSAGSFQDMTRVSTLNAEMWSELFLDNRDMLIPEVESLASRLQQYAQALRNGDRARLIDLLEEGTDAKRLTLEEGKK